MPLNMSMLGVARGRRPGGFPRNTARVIAGHSLGGAMAARYVNRHPVEPAGSSCGMPGPRKRYARDADFPVWVIHRAQADGIPPAKLEATRNLFPATSTWVPVPGGNHMQFGSFLGGTYEEEWPATILPAAEHDLIVTGTLNALLAMTPPPLGASP